MTIMGDQIKKINTVSNKAIIYAKHMVGAMGSIGSQMYEEINKQVPFEKNFEMGTCY